MGRVLLGVGKHGLFDRLDTTSFADVDVVSLKPLPYYAKPGTSLITNLVVVTNDTGVALTEILGGEMGGIGSVESFAYGANSVIRIAFAKGEFTDAEQAIEALADYVISFPLADSAAYVTSAYDVKIYDRFTEAKTFDSIIIGDEQLLTLMKSLISVADLQNMNPFRIEIFPQIRI